MNKVKYVHGICLCIEKYTRTVKRTDFKMNSTRKSPMMRRMKESMSFAFFCYFSCFPRQLLILYRTMRKNAIEEIKSTTV